MNTLNPTPFPAHPDLAQYRKQAKELLKELHSGDPKALERLRSSHPHPGNFAAPGAKIALADAQMVIAREHALESWPKFVKFVEEVNRPGASISLFEEAAEAVVGGNADRLRTLLSAHPSLIRARSERAHHCALLHYVGANGFEGYRQKTPKNAADILRILLQAGAEVDATADAYGRGTTLGLVATSVWPVVTGVQAELMNMLIDAGANVDGPPGSWNIAVASLANGRGPAAKLLVERGAKTDLESAAGTGKLDRVQSYFEPDGSLKPSATQTQFEKGFHWACEYGHDEVVSFLLDQGIDIDQAKASGLTGLHWAVVGAQPSTVRLLLSRGADLETVNVYGGTPLGQAVWSARNDSTGMDFRDVITALVEAGAKADCYPDMQEQINAILRD